MRGSVVHDRATINVAFHAASFSSVGGDRRKLGASGVPGSEGIDGIGLSRTTVGGRPDRKMIQWGHYVEDIFSTAVPLTLFPRSQIDISIEVLNADGGKFLINLLLNLCYTELSTFHSILNVFFQLFKKSGPILI